MTFNDVAILEFTRISIDIPAISTPKQWRAQGVREAHRKICTTSLQF